VNTNANSNGAPGRPITFWCERDLTALVDAAARALGISRSDWIRAALRREVERLAGHVHVRLTPKQAAVAAEALEHAGAAP
jgi:uncharacterized protein (DUF1778 family)